MIFSQNKLFCPTECYNAKNDVYSIAFEDIFENLQTVKHFQRKNSIMVSMIGKLSLKFIDKMVKFNAEYYKQNKLTTHLLLTDCNS